MGNSHGQVIPYTQEATANISILIGKNDKNIEQYSGRIGGTIKE